HKVTATADAITTTADAKATIDVLNNDTEATGGTLRISSFDQTSVKGGSISLASGKLSYIPAAGFTGTDTFTYTISNAAGDTDTATVTVTVKSNTASFAPDDDNYKVATADLDNQGEIALDVLTGDQYTGTVSIRITSSPSLGTISNVDASGKVTGTTVTYKPKDKTSGTDTFTYVLVDADGVVSPSATVTITLSNGGTTSLTFDAIDDGADGKDALYNFTTADFSGSIVSRTLTVLDNDIGKGLSIVAVTQPRFGTAKISSDGQSIIYTPRSGYCQSHTFTYTVRDSSGKEDTATIYINID
ncbi:MAG TPA: Ig-like domain-containing protein, partial [Thiolinea sp.]|nr:Ig-like domain-containing protein [Thiolinea sp.]